jgi:hypothetical protein
MTRSDFLPPPQCRCGSGARTSLRNPRTFSPWDSKTRRNNSWSALPSVLGQKRKCHAIAGCPQQRPRKLFHVVCFTRLLCFLSGLLHSLLRLSGSPLAKSPDRGGQLLLLWMVGLALPDPAVRHIRRQLCRCSRDLRRGIRTSPVSDTRCCGLCVHCHAGGLQIRQLLRSIVYRGLRENWHSAVIAGA